jgi:hypothetical protein
LIQKVGSSFCLMYPHCIYRPPISHFFF